MILGLLGVLCASLIVLYNRIQTGKILDHIEKMLDLAMDDRFQEEMFDESRMSALETRFAHYLSASAVSAKNVSMEKEKIKGLIADISHQTKTPISNLLLYSELLQEEELSESARKSADEIHNQSEKLRFLIDSLVKLSRLENGIISLFPRKQPIQPILESIVTQFTPLAQKKGLFLKLEKTDISASFDGKWTAEALGNIVDNAVKYTDHGGVTISAVGYELFVRIDISDSGIGIPEEEQAKIFTRFYRLEKVSEQPGVGIGLYLSRKIISQEGGYIKVTSRPGKGSVFSVFLPWNEKETE